jgi:hypothetical protein
MENNWEDFDEETKSTIKELTEDNKNFNELMAKLNSARESLEKKPELVVALQKVKK